ncbi:tetratricopeptide repeat protein, partial [Tautonia sp. JC769]|uniref:tetratricopeptide repeat protein n=1 Tax=Tautonia sp. JC769 TaxID=3232135 RepID=UPI00345757E7
MGNRENRQGWPRGGVLVTSVVVLAVAVVAWLLKPSDRTRWTAIERDLEAQRWDDAVLGLSRWVERHPDDGQARVRLGTSLRMIGRADDAREALRRVSDADPAWPTAQFLLGELARERFDRAGAERAYRAVIARQPGAVEPRSRLVTLLFVQRRTEEARALLWELLGLTGDARHLVTLTGLALERRQVEQFRDLGGEGDQLLQQLQPFLEVSPDDPWMRRARGLIRFEQGDPAGALADLEFAARSMEGDPSVRLALAEAWRTLGEPGRVAEVVGPAPESPTDLARWWLVIGQAEQEQGRDEEAIAAFRRAIAADPEHLSAHYRLGRALARDNRRDEADSILGRAEAIRGRTDALKFAINERLSEGIDAASCLQMGQLCLDTGMAAEAFAWFEQAIRLDPLDREAQAALARLGPVEPEPITPPKLREQVAEIDPRRPPVPVGTPAEGIVGPRFEDEATARGLAFSYDSGEQGDFFIADTMGGGVGLIDFDNDGWLDVYLVNGCPLPVDAEHPPAPNRLF